MRAVLLICILWMGLLTSEDFGYISYSSTNIGDDIQAIAARRLLPKGSVPIDREYIAQYHNRSRVNTIINGWYMHTKENWHGGYSKPPPSKSWPAAKCINPLLISMYLDPSFLAQAFSPKGLEYFMQHAPIGARDLYTLGELKNKGIPSYFSGCLTLTLDNPYKDHKRDNIIYAVDVNEKVLEFIRSIAKCQVISVGHGVPLEIITDLKARTSYARSLLNKYAKAKCVVTERLHAAMPCLAMGTPVLFLTSEKDLRMKGLKEFTHWCTKEKLLGNEFQYNFNRPPNNPTKYLSYRQALIEQVNNWVTSQANSHHHGSM